MGLLNIIKETGKFLVTVVETDKANIPLKEVLSNYKIYRNIIFKKNNSNRQYNLIK